MSKEKIFLALTGHSLARAEMISGQWQVSHQFEGLKLNCMVKNPKDPNMIYLGFHEQGILHSTDSGKTWESIGMKGIPVMSLAVDPQDPQTIYAGCKPVSLYVTRDGGLAWTELEAMRKTRKWWWFSPADPPGLEPYVSGLTVSPRDPNLIMAGIEVGAVMRSDDGGCSWSKHLRGADRDCHSLMFHHNDGDWVYEGGGVSGPAFSRDGGKTWQKPKKGLGKKYGWMVASDPERSDIWYLSASEQPKLLKGEFNPPGHQDGDARAHLYRKIGDAVWEQLSGGLPEPLNYMAYGLASLPNEPGGLYAGMANGEVWHTMDYGDHWKKYPFDLGGVHGAMVVI